jgi:long-chain acyl-CoA synthetase
VRKKGKENSLKIGMLATSTMQKIGIDVRRKIFSEILSAFGGNLKKIICGGAAMNPDLMKFFENLGITLCEGYGITECSPLIAVNPYYARKKGSVGPACDCCEVRIDADEVDENGNLTGEIQVRGDNVMLGYYKNPEANSEVFTSDGWFRTGDVGHLDKDKYIYITGRCKSVIVLENGKNVFPEEIEEYLDDIEEIAECVVVGRKKEDSEEVVLTAVVYPDFNKYEKNAELSEIASDIKSKVMALNKKLPSFKQIRNIEIRKTEFEKTTTRKIKRFLVK